MSVAARGYSLILRLFDYHRQDVCSTIEIPAQLDVARCIEPAVHRDEISSLRLDIEIDTAGSEAAGIIVARHPRQRAQAVALIDSKERVEATSARVEMGDSIRARCDPCHPDRMMSGLAVVERLVRFARCFQIVESNQAAGIDDRSARGV